MSTLAITLLSVGSSLLYAFMTGVAAKRYSPDEFGPLCVLWPLILPAVLGYDVATIVTARLSERRSRKALPAARVISQ